MIGFSDFSELMSGSRANSPGSPQYGNCCPTAACFLLSRDVKQVDPRPRMCVLNPVVA